MRTPRWRRAAALATVVLAARCERPRTPARAPWRPSAERRDVATLADAENVLHAGFAVPSGSAFEWQLPEDARGRLRLAWAAPDAAPATLVAELGAGDSFAPVARWTRPAAAAGAGPVFRSEDAELPRAPGGKSLRLRLEPPGRLFVSDPRIAAPDARAPAVVLLVFDTTRRDAVSFDGCVDPTSRGLDAIFRGGWIARRAYAPASWTIPSMAALLTGRVPEAHEDSDGNPIGIAAGIPTMAQDFRAAGWSTAAFVGNPTLRRETGFSAGFTTWFATPYDGSSITLPGRETVRRVPAWLDAHRGEPFFLWIHVMDPHDPYTPFDRARGKTPFDPSYTGPIVGDEVNRLQLGDPPPPSAADVRHLVALYHDEVRLADADFTALWNGRPAEERDRWTLAFTADHGEEFGEHGGWKHGPSLYDEILRVPLAIRPGRGIALPTAPAERLASLLDLLPTLEALAGLRAPARPLDGMDLFAAGAAQRTALPAVTMLTGGAARAAVVTDADKLLFFDRLGAWGVPDPAKDPNGFRLARRLPEILPALARFDLAADPEEKRPLALDVARFAGAWAAIERAVAHTRNGWEFRAMGTSPFEVSIDGFGASAAVEEFGLEENDRLAASRSSAGATVRARLDPSDGVDGFRVIDASPAALRIALESGCARLRLAGARPVALAAGAPQRIPRDAIPEKIPRFEPPGPCADVYLWRAVSRAPVRSEAEEDEAVRKLRALGYLH